jgi:outer membrane protein assembly factor BamB
MTPPDPERGPTGTVRTPTRRRTTAGVGLALAGVVVLGVAFDVPGRLGPGALAAGAPPADPQVELPRPDPGTAAGSATSPSPGVAGRTDELRPGASPDGDRALADPGPRCEPSGCIAWRWLADGTGSPRLAVADDLVLLADPNGVTGIDPATGFARWSTALPDLVPIATDGTPVVDLTGRIHLTMAFGGDVVVVATPNRVVALERTTGERRWLARSTGWSVWDVHVLDEVVVLSGSTNGGANPGPRLVALDLHDGSERWDHHATDVVDVSGPAVVVGGPDGALVGLEPADGSERWRLELDRTRGITREGPWLITAGTAGHRLLDPASGDELASFDRFLAHAVTEVDGLYVTVLLPGDVPRTRRRADPTPELVALRPDGEVVWRTPYGFAAPWRCCSAIVPWDGGVAVIGRDGTYEVRDVRTGALRETAPLDGLTGRVVPGPDGTLVAETGDGLLLLAPDGPPVRVDATGLRIEHRDPLVVSVGPELIGLRPRAAR